MRPNILLITGDHVRHDAVHCNLTEQLTNQLASIVNTPNLDNIAKDGISFMNSHTTNPICVPARASITTGNYPHKCTGCKGNGGKIKDGQLTIAGHFADKGYSTCAIGKLHYVPYSAPGEERLLHGFQHAELCEEGRIISQHATGLDDIPEGLEDYHDYLNSVGWEGYERAHGTGNNDVHPSPSPVPEEHHEESWVANRTINWLDSHQKESSDKPFFLWASFTKPHPPYDPPEKYYNMYDPREMPLPLADGDSQLLEGRNPELTTRKYHYGWDRLPKKALNHIRAVYCGMMTFQDTMIGRIVKYLKYNNLYENTIIVYTADHGDMLGDFGIFFKTNMHDGCVKVPIIIHAPHIEKTSANSKRDQLVGVQDIFPTLCSMTGCIPENYEFDGIDFTEAYKSENAETRKTYVSQTTDHPTQTYMLRTEEWKYVYSEISQTEELYKVQEKDYELTNYAGDPRYKDTLDQFRADLLKWCQENGDEQMIENGKLRSGPAPEKVMSKEISPNSLGWRKF